MTDSVTKQNIENKNQIATSNKDRENIISHKMSNVEFVNKSKCLSILNSYNVFNEKVKDESIDVSNYLKFIIEHSEKKDYETLLENQKNYLFRMNDQF